MGYCVIGNNPLLYVYRLLICRKRERQINVDNNKIVEAIRYHRENNEISSKDMAAVIGHHPATYSRIEKGDQPILGIEVYKIAKHLGMTMDELVVIPRKRK